MSHICRNHSHLCPTVLQEEELRPTNQVAQLIAVGRMRKVEGGPKLQPQKASIKKDGFLGSVQSAFIKATIFTGKEGAFGAEGPLTAFKGDRGCGNRRDEDDIEFSTIL